MENSVELVERFKKLPLGNVCDANGKTGNMTPAIKPVDVNSHLAGPAYPVQCGRAVNLALHRAIVYAPAGSVLVVDGKGYTRCGYFGDIMAHACMERKIAGLVIDGGVRDAEDLIELGFPVFSAGINPGGTIKENLGDYSVPVTCGGVAVNPGDWIVADRDGVVVIKRDRVLQVLEKAEAIAAKEIVVRRQLSDGKTTMEIYNLKRA